MDKRGFLSSGRYSEPDLPQMIYVYKICADTLIGRKDSNASTASADEVFSRGTVPNYSEVSSLDFVHPILSENDVPGSGQGLRSASFTLGASGPALGEGRVGSGRKKASGSKKIHRTGIDVEVDTTSVSSASEYSSHVSLESSACSSPDSEFQDDQQVVLRNMKRTGSGSSGAGSKGGLQFHITPSYNSPSTDS